MSGTVVRNMVTAKEVFEALRNEAIMATPGRGGFLAPAIPRIRGRGVSCGIPAKIIIPPHVRPGQLAGNLII